MQASTRLLALGAFAAVTALGSVAASAQTAAWNGGGSEAIGQSTSMSIAGTASSEEVNKGAMAAARPTGTEATGQSTAMPMPTGNTSSDEVYKGAVLAAHPSGTEAIGQSTALPMKAGS
ncbi:MAG: hypothetical protein JWQ73_1997 [Variovorax sp.]|jgi:hypothetical protein|nr:hypothetical protein [Variovorax sp.]